MQNNSGLIRSFAQMSAKALANTVAFTQMSTLALARATNSLVQAITAATVVNTVSTVKSFADMVKENPQMLLDKFAEKKQEIHDTLDSIKKSMVELKRNIEIVSGNISKTISKIKMLEGRVDKQQQRLNKVRNRIKELEAKGKELSPKEKLELVDLRKTEKEILASLINLNFQIESERNKLKTLESEKGKLEDQLKPLKDRQDEQFDSMSKVSENEAKFIKAFGIKLNERSRDDSDLTDRYNRYRKMIKYKYEKYRLENPSQISQTDTKFPSRITAVVDKNGDVNLLKTVGEMGGANYNDGKRFLYERNDRPSLRAKFSGARSRSGSYNAQHSRDNKEHGGKDNPSL